MIFHNVLNSSILFLLLFSTFLSKGTKIVSFFSKNVAFIFEFLGIFTSQTKSLNHFFETVYLKVRGGNLSISQIFFSHLVSIVLFIELL